MLGLRADQRGRLWYLEIPAVDDGTSTVASFDPRSGDVRTVHLDNEIAADLAVADDGSVWVTGTNPWTLYRIDPDTLRVDDLGSRLPTGARPAFVTSAGPHTMWFTDRTGAIDRVDTRTLDVRTYPLPAGSTPPAAIVVDRGFVDTVGDDGTLARLRITTGTITTVAGDEPSSYPHYGMTARADGTLWWTSQQSHRVLRFDPRDNRITDIALGPDRSPWSIVSGPDGAMWATEACNDGALVRIDPRTLAVTDEVPGLSGYIGLVRTRGELWFQGAANGTSNATVYEVTGIDAAR